MTVSVFIDGEVGTTGLQIKHRLSLRTDIQLISLPEKHRKTLKAREEALNSADVAILCLPDESAREAVSMVSSNRVRIIDASSAHRVMDGWTYGFPEYDSLQLEKIAKSKRIANPGCYAIASISILRPLILSGLLPKDFPATINAVSGYSGGGRAMISAFENPQDSSFTEECFRVYSLSLQHKHIVEIQKQSGLLHPPLFVPSVGRYRQGMIVQVPLPLFAIAGHPNPADIYSVLRDHYKGKKFVSVSLISKTKEITSIDPEVLNNTNEMHIHVFANFEKEQALIIALLDNLGKGAAGQVVQNLNIMFDKEESKGLLDKTVYYY
ncbi:MAG: N-acetyl-gamma-glutamyl-phosphate reductase [Alphaproteobacteria bacterium MarineAlpha3_Bin5]|nr:N-acetyl-gamma-glutamyl-phosphate reductase [Magnetovibrio sp.]PPR77458.1 MAG: N-acetyl-gamma-glutamyl-phosphate reductase [Alphaproteobacteria bacterium MarineAlpha3_Bin5]